MFKHTAAATVLALHAAFALAQTSAAPPGSNDKTILVVGDSLSAEYGIARDSGWVNVLRKRMATEYPGYTLVNASISGDTTSGGAARAPALIDKHKPGILILELGSNDALRGLPLAEAEKNLSAILVKAQAAGARTLVIGMMIPPNFGRQYADQFKAMFATVAQRYQSALVPFFFEGIALDQSYFQADGIHPNETAQEKLAANVWPVLAQLLQQAPVATAATQRHGP